MIEALTLFAIFAVGVYGVRRLITLHTRREHIRRRLDQLVSSPADHKR
jgi:hypothetical protein